ncbi:MAG: DUF2065 domain-containing protein [Pseudomonadota bacterium]
MGTTLLIAIALLLIIEGILPFLNPAALRKSLLSIAQMDDRTLRIGGLVSMTLGVALLYWVN